MADHSDQSTHFATLFETVTGQSTFTERQQIDIPVRYAERGEEVDISEYVDATATTQGFDTVGRNSVSHPEAPSAVFARLNG